LVAKPRLQAEGCCCLEPFGSVTLGKAHLTSLVLHQVVALPVDGFNGDTSTASTILLWAASLSGFTERGNELESGVLSVDSARECSHSNPAVLVTDVVIVLVIL